MNKAHVKGVVLMHLCEESIGMFVNINKFQVFGRNNILSHSILIAGFRKSLSQTIKKSSQLKSEPNKICTWAV